MKLKINIPLEIDLLALKKDTGIALLNNEEVIKCIKNEINKNNLDNAIFELNGNKGNKGFLSAELDKYNKELK